MTKAIIKSDCTASIGALLLDAGKISISDAERIIALKSKTICGLAMPPKPWV